MGQVNRDPLGIAEWVGVVRPLSGMLECGDRGVVAPFPDGVTLALIDGLGHGPEAALAARVIGSTIERLASLEPTALLARCHAEARSTRGAVIAVARVDARNDTLAWAGVGNVEAVLLRGSLSAGASREALVPRGGVIGTKSPPLHVTTTWIARGDVLVFTTDGIRGGYQSVLSPYLAIDAMVDAVHDEYGKETDDAGVLVARYQGGFATDATFELRDESDIVAVRQAARKQAAAVGLDNARVEALATAVTEIARNVIVHAGEGTVAFAKCTEGRRAGVLVVARDEGPGIDDLELAMTDGYTTVGTLGLGLPSARRLVDEFHIVSAPGRGTNVVMRKWAA